MGGWGVGGGSTPLFFAYLGRVDHPKFLLVQGGWRGPFKRSCFKMDSFIRIPAWGSLLIFPSTLGLCLLNLGLLMATDTAKRLNVPTRSCWLDLRTHRNLKNLCASTIMTACKCDTPLRWDSLTEINLEKRFGRIRTSFPNCCMTAADFWRSSATIMRKEVHGFQQDVPEPVPMDERLTSNEFCTIAQRSLQAALKFASMCSGRAVGDLQGAFSTSQAGAEFEFALAEGDNEHAGDCNEKTHFQFFSKTKQGQY